MEGKNIVSVTERTADDQKNIPHSGGYFFDFDVESIHLSLDELFKAGVHFGHKHERRHPRMDEYVYTYKDGLGIINLKKTIDKLEEAVQFIQSLVAENKQVVFVGTKKHASGLVRSAAERCSFPYVTERWLGGTFTNFLVMRRRLQYLNDLDEKLSSGDFAQYTKFEQMKKAEEYQKMEKRMGGLRFMKELPGAIFVVDIKQDRIAVLEAVKQRIPIIAFVDTNDDPSHIDYPIPANNDAISALKFILGYICKAVIEQKRKKKEVSESNKNQTGKNVE